VSDEKHLAIYWPDPASEVQSLPGDNRYGIHTYHCYPNS